MKTYESESFKFVPSKVSDEDGVISRNVEILTKRFAEQVKLGKEFSHILSGEDGLDMCPGVDQCNAFSDNPSCGVYFVGSGIFVDEYDEIDLS